MNFLSLTNWTNQVPLYLNPKHIVSIRPVGTTAVDILTITGVEYRVKDSLDSIMNTLKTWLP